MVAGGPWLRVPLRSAGCHACDVKKVTGLGGLGRCYRSRGATETVSASSGLLFDLNLDLPRTPRLHQGRVEKGDRR